jgi:hypothetical protein
MKCDHSGIGMPGCEICDPRLRARERVDHKQTAREIIARMKGVGPTCESCHRIDYNKAGELYRMSLLSPHSARGPGGTSHYMDERGYDEEHERVCFVRRCAACASRKRYPWADKLDVDKVAHMLEHDARCEFSFELEILRESIPIVSKRGFEFL